ncbi:MAG: TRAP transporter fused permease subunit, partial [Kiloniellales bacterium]|nr:TRAP transporter fused permease subunit [Kiloniellales bacterium]
MSEPAKGSAAKALEFAIVVLCAGLSLFNLYQAVFGIWEAYLTRALHLIWALVLIFLVYPLRLNTRRKWLNTACRAGDFLLTSVSASIGLYIMTYYHELEMRAGDPTTPDIILGLILIVLVLEATRRTLGLSLVVVSVVLLIYTIYGRMFPGPFIHSGFSLAEIVDLNFLSTEGIFGVPLGAVVVYIFVFIIFATFLAESGVSDFFRDFSSALLGHTRGGAAKVAVISSAFMGSITGSAAANVMTTGAFTIPAMKRLGYTAVQAASIEAAASTGGQIMPPIMAAAGFILASYIGVPYIQVAAAAVIPSLLYFFSVGVSVHLLSTRHAIMGMPRDQLPKLRSVLRRRGILTAPIFIVVWFLYYGHSPMKAGFYGILATIVASFFSKETRIGLVKGFWALEKSGRVILQLIATCACAGLIVSAIIMSGLGMKMPWLIRLFAGDNLLLSAALAGLGALILGMGMTTTAAYVIAATLLAPSLTHLGMSVLGAHLFLLYFAIINNVTPPVAIASYAAASLAESDLWKTAIRAFRLAIAGFIIPFFFLFDESLLLQGSVWSIAHSLVTSILGVISLSIGVEGYLFEEIPA